MKISVVIPVYNGADFINKSYQSIINQLIDDFEIIYVDNNSEDDSVAKIKNLVEKDTRVRLCVQPKQGAAPARNLGIDQAKGNYVYIFDVDDEIYPNGLNKMIAVLDKHKEVDAVFGKMVKSYQGIAETIKPKDETDTIVIKNKPYWGLYWLENLKYVVGPPAFLYRKSVFSKIGKYNDEIKNTEDTAFDIKLGMTSKVAFLDTYIYLYFKHSSSTIEIAKKNQNLVTMHWSRFVKSHLPFYLENEVPKRYKQLLYGYLYKTIAKRLFQINKYNIRNKVRKQLLKEIKPIKLPVFLNLYLIVFAIAPLSLLLKLYVYYLVPYYINNKVEVL